MGWLNPKIWTTWARDSIVAAIVLDPGVSTYLPAASQAAGQVSLHVSTAAAIAAGTV